MADTAHLLSQFYVKIDGQNASEEFMHDLTEVRVENSLHLPDVATLVLHDAHLHWVDFAGLAPGKTVQISAKSGQKEQPVFDGEIVELEPEFSPSMPLVVVRAFDRLHRLARGRFVRSYLNVSDADLVRKIGQEVGLQVAMDATSQVHAYVLQNNQTNLEFLRGRAAALGYTLFVQGKTLHCEPPRADGQPVPLEWGATLSAFTPRMTTTGQVDDVTVRGWDPATKREIVGRAQKGHGAPSVGEAKSGGELAHSAFNLPAQGLVTNRPVRNQATADQLAQAHADHAAARFIEAEGATGGNPAIIAGASVHVSAVGDRFSGTYLVTSAVHLFNAKEGYTTQFNVSGHHPATLFNLLSPARDDPPMAGMMIGLVTDNQDPDGQGRVKVKFPALSSDHASTWAPVVVPGGGAERGIEFLPEVNDEVLVAFEQGDVHHPFVLGGLWNGVDGPPERSDSIITNGRVQKRIIRSRTGHTIILDDSDGGGGITIQDKNGNKIVLDTASNALTIDVKGNASVKAQGNLSLEAQGQVTIKGAIINLN
ncbi:MAG: VgrG-related protein [Thermomicrobiales bacterium]